MKMRAPRKASAASRLVTPFALATTVSEWFFTSVMAIRATPVKVLAPRSAGIKNQCLDEKSASGSALCGRTLNQPLMPQASAMRPTSIASAGNSAASRPGNITIKSSRFFGRLTDQAFHRGRGLSANAAPVGQAVLGNADTLFIGSRNRVVKTQTLDETAVTTGALVSGGNIEKRACFCTATGESDDDHDLSFGRRSLTSII